MRFLGVPAAASMQQVRTVGARPINPCYIHTAQCRSASGPKLQARLGGLLMSALCVLLRRGTYSRNAGAAEGPRAGAVYAPDICGGCFRPNGRRQSCIFSAVRGATLPLATPLIIFRGAWT